MKLDDAIKKRRSIRKFTPKKVRWDKILEAIDAACQVPCAGNINHLKFIIVHNKEHINKIADCCQQDWVAEAPYIVVVCSDERKLTRMYDEDGKIYAKQQTGAAIQNFLLKITDMKLSSCWIGAYSENTIRNCLKIPKEIQIEAILPVGHASKAIKIKQPKKPSLQNTIFWEIWNKPKKPTFFSDPYTQ